MKKFIPNLMKSDIKTAAILIKLSKQGLLLRATLIFLCSSHNKFYLIKKNWRLDRKLSISRHNIKKNVFVLFDEGNANTGLPSVNRSFSWREQEQN